SVSASTFPGSGVFPLAFVRLFQQCVSAIRDAKLTRADLKSTVSASARSVYGRVLREFSKRPSPAAAFLVASAMHSAGHAALALAGGACALAMGGGGRLLDGGSTLADVGRAGPEAAYFLALVGLGAVAVKVVFGTWAAYAQARICGDVGGAVRLEVLD